MALLNLTASFGNLSCLRAGSAPIPSNRVRGGFQWFMAKLQSLPGNQGGGKKNEKELEWK